MKRNVINCFLFIIFTLILLFISGCADIFFYETIPSENISSQIARDSSALEMVASVNEMPWLDYSVELELSTIATTLDNPNDVVTPYIENLFHIRVKNIVQGGTMPASFIERYDAQEAAGNLPDVLIAGNENCAYAVASGQYGDLTEQIEKMDNLNKTIDPVFWPRFMNNGKKTQIPITGPDVTKEPYASDPYVAPMSSWGLWVREDILSKCGYDFITLEEIDENYLSKGLVAPEAVYQTNPRIKTPEDFYVLLSKIKNLDMAVGDAALIPWSSSGWSQFHLGCMFDFGHWHYNLSAGEADGFLGSPGAKEFYMYLNKLFQEGLIDKDFITQDDELIQSKISSGIVAAGMYIPSAQDAQTALYKSVGEQAIIRYIEWPKQKEGVGAFDIFENGFWRLVIRDDFPDKDRLTQYFDWFYSEEGQDILTWGPKSAGLWEYKNGVKRFSDTQVEEDCLNGVTGGKGADYWGLYTITSGSFFQYLSKAGICAPYTTVNIADYRRSFPPKLDIMIMNKAAVSLGGYDRSGLYAYGDGTETVSLVSSYYWSVFAGEGVSVLLNARSSAEFEAAWQAEYDDFIKKTGYDQARHNMADWFEENY